MSLVTLLSSKIYTGVTAPQVNAGKIETLCCVAPRRRNPPLRSPNLGSRFPGPVPFIPIRRLDRIYASALAHTKTGGNVFDSLLREMNVEYAVREADLKNVPAGRPLPWSLPTIPSACWMAS